MNRRQCIGNRLKEVFDSISTPFNLRESNDAIRIKLKRSLGFPNLRSKNPQASPDDGMTMMGMPDDDDGEDATTDARPTDDRFFDR